MESKIYNILTENNYIFTGKIGVTNFFLVDKYAKIISDLIKI